MKAKKLLVALSMLGLTSTVAFGQLQDQKDVTFTMGV